MSILYIWYFGIINISFISLKNQKCKYILVVSHSYLFLGSKEKKRWAGEGVGRRELTKQKPVTSENLNVINFSCSTPVHQLQQLHTASLFFTNADELGL